MKGLGDDISSFKDSFIRSAGDRDVNLNWETFKSELFRLMDKHIPQKKLSSWQDVPWMTNDIKRQIRKKKRLYNKAKRADTDQCWQDFRDMRKVVKASMRKSYEEYINGIFTDSDDEKQSHKRFWKFVNSRKKDSGTIPTLKTAHGLATDNLSKAEALNKQYESVFTEESREAIPNKGPSPYMSMSNITFTLEGIERMLKSLDSNKACGPDLIPVRILKGYAKEIAPILQVIFIQSYDTGELPQDWLTANIVPVYKKGNKCKPENYRPISLTCVTSKLMEHVIFHSIMEHLDENDILVKYQHGFRKKHSTESQLITTLEELSRSLDSNHQTDVMILDFSKAFDKVAHHRLLSKLKYYGIRDVTLSWISTWLTTRSQRVVVDGETSKTVHVTSGVPQGTVLGPLMFLLFINDIGDEVDSTIKLFADDCLLMRRITSVEDTVKLQSDMDRLLEWADRWQMQFNAKKCYSMRIHRKRHPIIHDYTMRGDDLLGVANKAYLGIELHERLSWKLHVDAVTNKASRTLGFIRRNLGRHCPTDVKKLAYISLVRSQLEYASVVWDPNKQNQIDQLEMVQRRALRFICGNYQRDASVTAMREQLNLPTLEERRKRARLTMFYKIVNNRIAIPIPDYIKQRERTTRRSQQQRYMRLGSSMDTYKFSFFPRTLKDWDELPQNIVELPSLEQFKVALETV